VASASFMFQVSEFLKFHIGEGGLRLLIGFLLISGSLFFMALVLRRSNFLPKTALITAGFVIGGLALVWRMRILQERIHILEYALLGYLVNRDAGKVPKRKTAVMGAYIFVFMVSFLDEGFQKILPYRVFDWRDILFNILGGLWGAVFYWLPR